MEWKHTRTGSSSSQPGILRAPSGSAACETAFAAMGSDRQATTFTMYRTASHTTPGRIESISGKSIPILCSSFQSLAGHNQAAVDPFMLGATPFQQNSMQQQHNFWQAQPQAAATSNHSFSFQRDASIAAEAGQDTYLESLFSEAEATVDKYLDSPQAAMLFGNDITDALSRLCANEPGRREQGTQSAAAAAVPAIPAAAAATCTSSGLAAACGSNLRIPQTPQNGRKRSKPCIGDTVDDDVIMEPVSEPGGSTKGFGQRFNTDSGFAGRRWGLDLSDEGSGRAVWRHSTGGSLTAAAAAAGSDSAAGPLKHHSQNLEPHRGSANVGSNVTCGSIHGTKHRVLKIKPHGGLSPRSKTHGTGLNRSSCPGGYLGRMSSSAAAGAFGGAFAAVLDLSQPDPNSNNGSSNARTSPEMRPVAAAAAAAGVGGSSSSNKNKLAGFKHQGSPICCLDLSGDDGTPPAPIEYAAAPSTAAAAAAAAGNHTESVARHVHPASTPSCISPRQQSSNGCMPPAAAAAGQNNNLSFTSWAAAGTTAAAAAAGAAAVSFQSPFSNRAAMAAALFSPRPEAAAAAAAETGPGPAVFTPRKMRKSTTTSGIPDNDAELHKPQQQQQQQQQHFCCNCGAVNTPLWRNGPAGPKTLCNACGVRYKKGGGLAGFEEWKRKSSSSGGGSTPPSPEAAHAALVAALKAAAITAATGGCTTPPPPPATTVQLSPFGTPQQQQQQQWPAAAVPAAAAGNHVGVSITTQSGTGPLARRVSSQLLVFPGCQISADLGFSTEVQTMDFGQGFTSDGGAACAANGMQGQQQPQQQRILHLQLPRIRTTSLPMRSQDGGLNLYGLPMQSGFGTSSTDRTTNPSPGTDSYHDSYNTASGSGTRGTNGSNSSSDALLTPQVCQPGCAMLPDPAAAAAAAGGGGGQGGFVSQASPSSLSSHIAHMSLYGANHGTNSPASCLSSGGTVPAILMDTPAAAAAAGACPSLVPVAWSPFGVPHVQQQQQQQYWQQEQQQQQQRSSVRSLNTDAALDADLVQLVGHTVTTGLPVRAPRSTAPASFGTVQPQQQQQQPVWQQQQQRGSMWQVPQYGTGWV